MEAIDTIDAITSAKLNSKLNWLEQQLAKCPQQEMPVTHRFTPGLYIREIFMPKGTLLTSKIHRTEHPFVISKGKVSVYTEEDGEVVLQAPFCGITKPGTRRALFIHEDTVWTTFHPSVETDLDKLEEQLIEPHDIPPLSIGLGHFDSIGEGSP